MQSARAGMLAMWTEVQGVQIFILSTFSIPCPSAFVIGLQGVNPTLPERLTGKQESKKEGMEGGRRGARSGAQFPFTTLQTLLCLAGSAVSQYW